MDVVDRSFDRIGMKEISIESGTFLPESNAVFPESFTDRECMEQLGVVLGEDLLVGSAKAAHTIEFLHEGVKERISRM